MIRLIRVFHLRDHLLAAAGIAGDGIDRHRIVFRQDAGLPQRADESDRAGRVAAGIGDEPGVADLAGWPLSISAKP